MWLFTVAKYFALANFLFGTVKCAKKMTLILIIINILDVVLDIINAETFRYLMVTGLVKIK